MLGIAKAAKATKAAIGSTLNSMVSSDDDKKSPLVVDNPMPHVIPEGDNATPLEVVGGTASDKLVIILVGLPGTGKTHMAKRICRYISFFLDIPAEIFNVGDYRRKLCGTNLTASFYDPNNSEAVEKRNKACNAALNDLVNFMKTDGVRLAVLDSTNSTLDRRELISKHLDQTDNGFKKIFVETLCDDEALLEEHIKSQKMCTPDYKDMDPDEAVKDFKQRRQNYMSVYSSLEDSEGSYIKIFNNKKFVIHNVHGYLPLKVSCRFMIPCSTSTLYISQKYLSIKYIYLFEGCSFYHESAYASKDFLPYSSWSIRI